MGSNHAAPLPCERIMLFCSYETLALLVLRVKRRLRYVHMHSNCDTTSEFGSHKKCTSHMEFCLLTSSLFFWVQSMSFYIDMKMMRPPEWCGCNTSSSTRTRPALQLCHKGRGTARRRGNRQSKSFPVEGRADFHHQGTNPVREDMHFGM